MQVLNLQQTKIVSGSNSLIKNGNMFVCSIEHGTQDSELVFAYKECVSFDINHAENILSNLTITPTNCSSHGFSFFQQEILSGVTKYTFQLS